MQTYDIIIVGAGIAGLYSAYRIKKKYPSVKLAILEKYDYHGGRMGNKMFEGESVVTGAGVGRKAKDKLLIKLLKEMSITTREFTTGPAYASTIQFPCEVRSIFFELKKQYNCEEHGTMTFKKYATSILGKKTYGQFIVCAGYTDYEVESAYETLYHYGFDDNFSTWTALGISWKELVEKLARKIGVRNILYSQEVQRIYAKHSDNFANIESYIIETKANGNRTIRFETKHVILATTVEPLKKILPGASSKNSIYQQIHSQHFLRIYGKFSKASTNVMKAVVPNTMIVPGPLHKIIPMNPDKGIYMIAYTDNEGATLLHKYEKNTKYNRDALARLLEKSIGIPPRTLELESITECFWNEGTHYYEPLKGICKNRDYFIKLAQHPYENIWVVGEMVSKKQGWVEGALESVEAVIDEVLDRVK